MIGIPGFSKRLFEALSHEKINVILITQSSSEHSICVGIEAASAEKAKQAVDDAFANEIALQKVEPLKVEADLSIVALGGENMKNHTGISGRMFSAIGKKWCKYPGHCTGLIRKKYFCCYFHYRC